MYNPYQQRECSTANTRALRPRIFLDEALTFPAPGLYGRPPEYGAYPGGPPGMGKFRVIP